jgi:hypothetical protein
MFRVQRLAAWAACVLAAIVLSGCSQVQLVHQVSEHNEALELSGNQVVLLNAIRASKGYPYYFTYLGDMQGKDAVNATIDASPQTLTTFANHQQHRYFGRPSVALNNGFSTFAVSNANSDDFAVNLITPLTADQASVLINSDWPTEHLLMLILKRIGLSEQDFLALKENFEARCHNPTEGLTQLCALEQDAVNRCGFPEPDAVYDSRHKGSAKRIYNFRNNPEEDCPFEQFQIAVRAIVLASPSMLQLSTDSNQNKTSIAGGGKARGKSDEITANKGQQVFQINVNNNQSDKKDKEEKTKLHLRVELRKRSGLVQVANLLVEGTRSEVGATYFVLRSPGDIIDYLGRLIKVQLRDEHARMARVLYERRYPVPILLVKRGVALGRTAISVTHEGERFYVPTNSYDPAERHMSMQSLMLVNELLAMKLKRDNLKNATTLFIGQ